MIVNDTSYASHLGCTIVMQNIKLLLLQRNIKIIGTNPVNVNWRDNHDFLRLLEEADIVIVNGEGTLHHADSRYWVKDLILIGRYIKENYEIPIVVINTTYQDNGNEVASLTKYFDQVYVRERLSQADLRQYGIESIVVPDLSFYSTFDTLENNQREGTGVTDSVYPDKSIQLFGVSRKNGYLFLPIYSKNKFKKMVKKEFAIREVKYWLKHLLWSLKIPLHYHRVKVFYYLDSYADYINKIAHLEFLITGRYHALCFALKANTPFFAVKSNSHKIEGMLQDIGIGTDRIVEIDKIVAQNVQTSYLFTTDESEKIRRYVKQAPRQIDDMFDRIEKLL